MIKSLLTACGLCFVLAVTVHAQGQVGTSGKVRPNKDKPPVYVTYERSGVRIPLNEGESKNGYWLRLHNNTKWKLILRVNGVPNPSYGDAILFYQVDRIRGSGFTPVGYSSHVASIIKLKAGSSILFSLPQEHLAEGLAIRLRYNYEWEMREEGSSPASEPAHTVTFSSSDLPRARR